MRAPHALLVGLAVTLAATVSPVSARADEPIPTTTTLTAPTRASGQQTVTYPVTATVAAADESVPGGTVELREDGAVVASAPLVDGSATWSRTVPVVRTATGTTHTYTATYLPGDGWAPSASEPTRVAVHHVCSIRVCEGAEVSIRVAPTLRSGRRPRIRVDARILGGTRVPGRLTVRLSGHGLTYSVTNKFGTQAIRVRGPRLVRSGRYRVVARFVPDDPGRYGGGRDAVTFRVVRR